MNEMLSPTPGAATMCNPAVITACRVAYRAAAFVGDPTFSREINRAWRTGDAEMLVAHLDGLAFALCAIEGAWDLREEVQRAATRVRATEAWY